VKRLAGILLFASFFGFSTLALAEGRPAPLSFRWTSVAGFLLDDGETTLSFDPIFTRPGPSNWLWGSELVPDSAAIEENLNYLGLKKVDAVFVSHEHFDHAVDAPTIAHRFGAPLYGGPSLERIATANAVRYGWKDLSFRPTGDRDVVQVGKFKIKFLRRAHAPIFPKIDFHFLAGEVPKDFHFGFYQYYDGDVWCWLIEHPAGRVFVDQGAHFFEGAKPELGDHVDYMLLGVANKKSVEDWVSKYIVGFRPKLVLPLHFDFFFTAPDRAHTKMLPGTQYDDIVDLAAKVSPKTRFRLPKFGESIFLD
jgi:L-ascorbate metabolism protein UlaG (beta-lactamase superfamily)